MADQRGLVGNAIDSQYSPSETRLALRNVKVSQALPAGADVLGDISTRRCHENFTEESPSEPAISTQLRVMAYAQGADGITNLRFDKLNGLLANCWYILEGRATMFALRK
jgi:hypothetical protein